MLHFLKYPTQSAGQTFNNATNAAQFVWLASHYYTGNCDEAQCRSPYNCQVCALAYGIKPNATGLDFGSAPSDVRSRWAQESCKISEVCQGIVEWYNFKPGEGYGDASKIVVDYYQANCQQ